jgi:hypothetical protein
MKALIIITFVVTILQAELGAQSGKPREIKGKRTEGKAENSVYVFVEQGDGFKVFNKANVLMITESRFEEMSGYAGYAPVKFSDKPKLDSLVYKIIAPYYIDFKSVKYSEDIHAFVMYLYSGLDRKITEMSFFYDKEAKIPLKAIEKLEQQVLAAGLKLDFDANNDFFKGSTWVELGCPYSVAQMKKRLKEKGE